MAAIHWIHGLLGMFLVTLLWIAFTPAIHELYDVTTSLTTDPDALATMANLLVVWNVWPWVFVFGFVFYAIVSSQKREYDTTAY